MSQLAIDRKTLVGRDYIETLDWTVEEIDEAVAVAASSKSAFRNGSLTGSSRQDALHALPRQVDPDAERVRVQDDQLGGHAIYLDAEKTQVAHGESPKDMGVILSRYGHGLAIRHDLAPYEGNAWMREIARWADIPLINLQCDVDHPTQTLADLMTLREQRGENLRGLKVAVSWAYAPSYAKPLSVPQGLATLLPRFGIDVVLAHPPEGLRAARSARAGASDGGGGRGIDHVHERHGRGVRGADVVYPKSWGRLDAFSNEKSALAESAEFKDWICDARRLARPVPTCCTCTACRRPGTGHGRGHRRAALGRVRRGREPDAHREGALCVDHGWLDNQTP